jgi:hypothetical protein
MGELYVTFLKTSDIRFRIIEDVPKEVRQVPPESVDVGAIPAAARHRWGQSADKLKALKFSRRLRQHGSGHAMIPIENGQGAPGINSNQ